MSSEVNEPQTLESLKTICQNLVDQLYESDQKVQDKQRKIENIQEYLEEFVDDPLKDRLLRVLRL